MNERAFLKAEWRKLIMANYRVDPSILKEYLPAKTELDYYNSACYVSLVGFMFKEVRVKGLKIPGHVNFPEVNLRFYVRHFDQVTKEWKRGVVFISEIVPKPAITFAANTLYKEKYSTMPMRYKWEVIPGGLNVSYHWKKRNSWNKLEVVSLVSPGPLLKDSEEEFITEHFWGYSAMTKYKTAEYRVEHPRWEIYQVKDHLIDCDFSGLYGKKFSFLNMEKPHSVFLAEGSPITIYSKRNL